MRGIIFVMLDEFKKGKLDRLQRKLYSRSAPNSMDVGRTDLKGEPSENADVKENWQTVRSGNFDELAAKVSMMAGRKNNFIKKVFVFSVLFFVLAAAIAAFVFFGGINMISSKNVDIKVTGPISVGGGQEVSFDINVINNNNENLESASLLVEYPEGARSPADLSKELSQERYQLGNISSGESYSQNIKAAFFGEKDATKQIKISLEYRLENSSALFYKEKMYELSISSDPVIVTPTYPKEVNSNQNISFDIELASNSKDKISSFLVNVEYPSGFIFSNASPSPSFGNNIWKFTDFNTGDKKTISINGSIIGQDNEEKVFKITAGTPSEDDERAIKVSFSQLMESVLVKKPFIGLGVSINGNKESDYAAQGGSQVSTSFSITNNLSDKLYNVTVETTLSGGAFDKTSVIPSNDGFFQSSNNTIVWDKRTISEFSEMDPGSKENLSFRLVPLLYSSVPKGSKAEIVITTKVKGERILESGSAEEVFSTETRKIVLATDITLSAKSARSLGNIENSGPIPPKTEVPTTYTIIWSVNNSFNQVSNVVVRATLPSYVKWTELSSPSSEIFSFNKETNEVIWNAGSVLANTGFGSAPKQVYFQLEFLPSVSQLSQTPIILGESKLTGIDKITGQKIEASAGAVTTDFSGDPTYKMGDERVTQ